MKIRLLLFCSMLINPLLYARIKLQEKESLITRVIQCFNDRSKRKKIIQAGVVIVASSLIGIVVMRYWAKILKLEKQKIKRKKNNQTHNSNTKNMEAVQNMLQESRDTVQKYIKEQEKREQQAAEKLPALKEEYNALCSSIDTAIIQLNNDIGIAVGQDERALFKTKLHLVNAAYSTAKVVGGIGTSSDGKAAIAVLDLQRYIKNVQTVQPLITTLQKQVLEAIEQKKLK